ncbi:uncharacterized protein LOC114594727 isoform X3 [Podarcis muralis]
MLSAILHGTLEAVLGGPQKEEDREELKRRFRLLLGSLPMEAPNSGTLLQLLSMTVIRPDLACFWRRLKEDDIIIEDMYSVQTSGSAGHQREATGRQQFSRSWPASGQVQKVVSPTPWGQRSPFSLVCLKVCTQDSPLRSSCWESCRTCSLPGRPFPPGVPEEDQHREVCHLSGLVFARLLQNSSQDSTSLLSSFSTGTEGALPAPAGGSPLWTWAAQSSTQLSRPS